MAAKDSETLPDHFDGTNPDPVPDGGILTVCYTDTGKAKETIAVLATDADDASESWHIEIRLRGNGKGTAQFIVPAGWGGVVLTADGSRPHTVPVALPP